MVIRNKEERSDSIWRFVAVAAIPLLLLFFAGFSLGDTSEKEQKNYKKLYEAAALIADSLQEKAMLHNAFGQRAEALLKLADQKTDDLDKRVSAAASASDGQTMILLAREEAILFQDMDDSIFQIRNKFKAVVADPSVQANLSLLTAYIGFKRIQLMKHRVDLMTQINAGNAAALQGELEKIQAEKDEIKDLLEAQKSGSEIGDLKAQLRECNSKLAAAGGGSNKNKEIVAKIKAQLNDVQINMLPSISDTKFKNDSKKLNELKTQISNSLMVIATDLGTVQ